MSKVIVREFLPTVDSRWILDMNLREADRREFEASSGVPGNQPILDAALQSNRCMVAIVKGQIAALWGVHSHPPVGLVWACGTDEMVKHPSVLEAESEKFFRKCLETHLELTGAIDSRNTVHIRWLERHGFTIYPNRLRFSGVQFHIFRRTQCAIQS